MGTPVRLLISARDVGAAKALHPLIAAALADPAMDVTVVAQQPASIYFAENAVVFRSVISPPVPEPKSEKAGRLLAEARELHRELKPDVLLTGLSGPDLGIDEALIATAETNRVFSYQDYEGWVVPGFGKPARSYIVQHEEAASASRGQGVNHTVLAGWVAYAGWTGKDFRALRTRFRSHLPKNKPVVSVFGQSFTCAGYRASICALGRALTELGDSVTVLYRNHPRQSEQESAADRQALGLQLSAPPSLADLDTTAWLAGSDCAVSCLSTIGLDLMAMNALSPVPLAVPVYVLSEPDIRQIHVDTASTPAPWPVVKGAALAAWNDAEISQVIKKALLPETTRQVWQAAQGAMTISKQSAAAVLERIVSAAPHGTAA